MFGKEFGKLHFLEEVAKGLYYLYQVDRVLAYERSEFQSIAIVENPHFGKCLFLDGVMQTSTLGEHYYHELLVHPAMLSHPNPRRVLIIGGGDGGTAREVLKHDPEEVVMVELDRRVVELCREHMPEINQGAFDDPRLRLVFQDGRRFVEECRENFDVVIVDLTDPIGGARRLFTREFYQILRSKVLGDGGIMVTQAESPYRFRREFATIYNTVRDVFSFCVFYQHYVPCYETIWGFIMASERELPEVDVLEKRYRERRIETRFYDPYIQRFLEFAPREIREFLEGFEEISTDERSIERE